MWIKRAFDSEWWAAEQSLKRLQRKLETLPGWRESLAWEVVEHILIELDQGMFDALESPHMPKDFRHWRDKYSTRDDLL